MYICIYLYNIFSGSWQHVTQRDLLPHQTARWKMGDLIFFSLSLSCASCFATGCPGDTAPSRVASQWAPMTGLAAANRDALIIIRGQATSHEIWRAKE